MVDQPGWTSAARTLVAATVFGCVSVLTAAEATKATAGASPQASATRSVGGQKTPAKSPPRVARDLLGVSIGDRESDVLPKLDAIGKRLTSLRRDGGRRHTIALHETPFTYLIVVTNEPGEVRRISGFVRPGQEIPFEVLGDTESPSGSGKTSMFWDMLQEGPDRKYRLVAKGNDRKAQVIFLIGAPKRGAELNDTVELPNPPAKSKK